MTTKREVIEKIIQEERYHIDVNVFDIIQEHYKEHFDRDKNKLGCSELAFCARKTLINRIFFPGEFIGNMKMLSGKIHHGVIQHPEVLSQIIDSICFQLGITNNLIQVKTEKVLLYEVTKDKYIVVPKNGYITDISGYKCIEGHIDVWTDMFLIEIKTTNVPVSAYNKNIAPYHYIQLNTYLGFSEILLGWVLKIHLQAYISKITDISDIWRKYGVWFPVVFNKEIFDSTIEKAKTIFEMLEKDSFNLAGPQFEIECSWCDKKIKKICGR